MAQAVRLDLKQWSKHDKGTKPELSFILMQNQSLFCFFIISREVLSSSFELITLTMAENKLEAVFPPTFQWPLDPSASGKSPQSSLHL